MGRGGRSSGQAMWGKGAGIEKEGEGGQKGELRGKKNLYEIPITL